MDNENIFFFFAGLQQKCVEKLLYQLQKDYKRYHIFIIINRIVGVIDCVLNWSVVDYGSRLGWVK